MSMRTQADEVMSIEGPDSCGQCHAVRQEATILRRDLVTLIIKLVDKSEESREGATPCDIEQ